jgi:hypothetical protein
MQAMARKPKVTREEIVARYRDDPNGLQRTVDEIAAAKREGRLRGKRDGPGVTSARWVLMGLGGLLVGAAIIADTIYSFTPKGRFGLPTLFYGAMFVAGIGLFAAARRVSGKPG